MEKDNPPPYEWELIQYDEVVTAQKEQLDHIKNAIIDILQLELDNSDALQVINIDFKYKNIAITLKKTKKNTFTQSVFSGIQTSGLFVIHHLTSLRLLIKFL
jgi:hypothetical protein